MKRLGSGFFLSREGLTVENPDMVELARLAALAPDEIPGACGLREIVAAARALDRELFATVRPDRKESARCGDGDGRTSPF